MRQHRRKKAQVRYYIDADLLGLAKLLVQVRTDVTYPGDPGGELHKRHRPACPVRPEAKDTEWLPTIAGLGWLIITRDWHIGDHTREIAAVQENKARMVTLASNNASTKFDQLELLMRRWRDIEKLLDTPGPFIYEAHRTTMPPILKPPNAG